jgi:hypothetical protein
MGKGLEVIRRGASLIEAARRDVQLAAIGSMQDFLPGRPGALDWRKDPWFASAAEILAADRVSFERDVSQAQIRESVRLPAMDGGEPIPVRTFIAGRPMQSRLHKYWVRAHGFPFFICPESGPNDSGESCRDQVFHRVILSVDPNFDVQGRKPHLLGLGFNLERLEVKFRAARNRGHDDRSGAPRFGDGYCDNDDPWYDGRAFAHTIVDSPRSGTFIPFAEIVRTACELPFWEVPLRGGLVSMVWQDRDVKEPPDARPLTPHPALASTLEYFHKESSEARLPAPPWAAGLVQCALDLRVRLHPVGTCKAFVVATITALPGATLESLVAARAAVIGNMGNGPPGYSFSRIVPDRCCSEPSRTDHLLRRLNDGAHAQVTQVAEHEQLLLFNNRYVVLRGHASTDPPEESRAELEVLLYLAFLNETMADFSRQIGELVPPGRSHMDSVSATPVCRDFLRFQARYYQLDVCRTGRGRLVWEKLAGAVSLAENYVEVRSELDRLAQLEAEMAEQRRTRAERLLQLGLYMVALFGVYQTVIAYYGTSQVQSSASFWPLVSGITVLAVGFYVWAAGRNRGRGPRS